MCDDRVDWFPVHYEDNPIYWKNFVDWYISGPYYNFNRILMEEYNVEYISNVVMKPHGTKIIFKTLEDFVHFKLRWS